MSKKKHPEHVNHERWLVSYADFITLLFAFFVVLFASGQNDKRKQIKLAEAMTSAFAQLGIFEPRSKTPALTDTAGNSGVETPMPLEAPIPSKKAEEAAKAALSDEHKMREALDTGKAAKSMPAGSVVLRSTPEGLVISLREVGFFLSGSSEVRPEALPLLDEIAKDMPSGSVRVEGHTDDRPIHTAQFPSNWELSSARAGAITRILLEDGRVAPTEIAAQGLAEFHPIADNSTEMGRGQNRRVDIIVLRRQAP